MNAKHCRVVNWSADSIDARHPSSDAAANSTYFPSMLSPSTPT
jgi:hypothetical protein